MLQFFFVVVYVSESVSSYWGINAKKANSSYRKPTLLEETLAIFKREEAFLTLHQMRFIESIALLVEVICDRHINIVSDEIDNFTHILRKEASK